MTTIVAVRKDGKLVMAGDGRISTNNENVYCFRQKTIKVLRLYNDRILAGISGSTSGASYMLDYIQKSLEQSHGDLQTAVLKYAKAHIAKKEHAPFTKGQLLLADDKYIFNLNICGHIDEPDEPILSSIGSGSIYAYTAARALLKHNPELDPEIIVKTAMGLAAELDPCTNDFLTIETLQCPYSAP